MFKKYAIIALGALIIGGEASGMSYLRHLWAPSAVAAAGVLAAKTTLCEEKPKGLGFTKDYAFKGEQVVAVLKKCGIPTYVCRDKNGGYSDCDFEIDKDRGFPGGIGSDPKAFKNFLYGASVDDELAFARGERCLFHGLFYKKDAERLIQLAKDRESIDGKLYTPSYLIERIRTDAKSPDDIARDINGARVRSIMFSETFGEKQYANDDNFLRCFASRSMDLRGDGGFKFKQKYLDRCKQEGTVSQFAGEIAQAAVERYAELDQKAREAKAVEEAEDRRHWEERAARQASEKRN